MHIVNGLGGSCDVAPAWCAYTPFSDFMDVCKPFDPRACQEEELRGTSMTPENIQRALEAGDRTIAADMAANPELYEDYNNWVQWRPFYDLDAAGTAQALVKSPDFSPWIIGGAALAAAWLLTR